jgi:hypothetical protein
LKINVVKMEMQGINGYEVKLKGQEGSSLFSQHSFIYEHPQVCLPSQ